MSDFADRYAPYKVFPKTSSLVVRSFPISKARYHARLDSAAGSSNYRHASLRWRFRPDISSTSRQDKLVSKKNRSRKPVQVELALPPGESEVTIGGETFSVKLRSTAPLGEIVQKSLDVYRACAPQEARKSPVGFAGPGAGAAEISGPVGQNLFGMDLD